MPLARRPAGNVPNLPLQSWFLPLIQRVSEWQPICVTYGYVFSWGFMSSRRAYRRLGARGNCTGDGRVCIQIN